MDTELVVIGVCCVLIAVLLVIVWRGIRHGAPESRTTSQVVVRRVVVSTPTPLQQRIPFKDLYVGMGEFLRRMTVGTSLCVVPKGMSYEVWWNKPDGEVELVATLLMEESSSTLRLFKDGYCVLDKDYGVRSLGYAELLLRRCLSKNVYMVRSPDPDPPNNDPLLFHG